MQSNVQTEAKTSTEVIRINNELIITLEIYPHEAGIEFHICISSFNQLSKPEELTIQDI